WIPASGAAATGSGVETGRERGSTGPASGWRPRGQRQDADARGGVRRHPDSNRGMEALQTSPLTTWVWRRTDPTSLLSERSTSRGLGGSAWLSLVVIAENEADRRESCGWS